MSMVKHNKRLQLKIRSKKNQTSNSKLRVTVKKLKTKEKGNVEVDNLQMTNLSYKTPCKAIAG